MSFISEITAALQQAAKNIDNKPGSSGPRTSDRIRSVRNAIIGTKTSTAYRAHLSRKDDKYRAQVRTASERRKPTFRKRKSWTPAERAAKNKKP